MSSRTTAETDGVRRLGDGKSVMRAGPLVGIMIAAAFYMMKDLSTLGWKELLLNLGVIALLSLFAASEIGGSAPVTVLKPSGATTLPDGSSALTVAPGAVQSAVSKLMNG